MASDALVVKHTSEFGEWEAVSRDPHPALAPYVTVMSGWVESTTFARRREVPFVGCVLIININNRLNISDPLQPETLQPYHAFFAGLCNRYVVTESTGEAGGIQVNLTPSGARMLLGIPAHELANRVVHLEEVLGPEARTLIARLEDTPDWADRFDLVEDVIMRRLVTAECADPGVTWALERLGHSHGLASIRELGSALGWTPKTLIDRFRYEVGLAPKQVARMMRFSRAVELLSLPEPRGLRDIAVECGYYDQAHLNREFREFAGSTPLEFQSRLVPESGGVLDAEPGGGVNRP